MPEREVIYSSDYPFTGKGRSYRLWFRASDGRDVEIHVGGGLRDRLRRLMDEEEARDEAVEAGAHFAASLGELAGGGRG